jgi:hypothetical protein
MATDIKLDEGDGNWLVIEGSVLKTTAADLMLDSPSRRRQTGGFRRALVHDTRDGLTINFNGDYPDGVSMGGNLNVAGEIRWATSSASPKNLSEVIKGIQDQIRGSPAFDADRFRQLELTVESLVALLNASVVQPWTTVEEVEKGDDMGMHLMPASSLGFTVQYRDLQGNVFQGGPYDRPPEYLLYLSVARIEPPAGTVLPRGSEIVVVVKDAE